MLCWMTVANQLQMASGLKFECEETSSLISFENGFDEVNNLKSRACWRYDKLKKYNGTEQTRASILYIAPSVADCHRIGD